MNDEKAQGDSILKGIIQWSLVGPWIGWVAVALEDVFRTWGSLYRLRQHLVDIIWDSWVK